MPPMMDGVIGVMDDSEGGRQLWIGLRSDQMLIFEKEAGLGTVTICK